MLSSELTSILGRESEVPLADLHAHVLSRAAEAVTDEEYRNALDAALGVLRGILRVDPARATELLNSWQAPESAGMSKREEAFHQFQASSTKVSSTSVSRSWRPREEMIARDRFDPRSPSSVEIYLIGEWAAVNFTDAAAHIERIPQGLFRLAAWLEIAAAYDRRVVGLRLSR